MSVSNKKLTKMGDLYVENMSMIAIYACKSLTKSGFLKITLNNNIRQTRNIRVLNVDKPFS